MVFTTATFLVFLAVVFALYWMLPSRRWQNQLLVVAGYAFYAWWDYRYCALMVISTLVDFFCGRGCANARHKKLFLSISLVSNLGLLGAFKYFDFFQDSLLQLLTMLGITVDPFVLSVALPVGISFYTFQTLSYTIDIYRGQLRPHDSLLDYAAYVCFFPQLVAGPIERASSLLPQFAAERRFCSDRARDGLRQIAWGFFKKLVIADHCGAIVNEVYAQHSAYGSSYLWLASVGFAFQIYCDFSAYSDIAIGTANLFGFSLTRNFAFPYFSQDFVEFWRRWHITLSTWFRDYVYIPLGGNHVASVRRMTNVLIVFGVSGLWHGAGWNFVIWGITHGILVIVSSRLSRRSLNSNSIPLGGMVPHPVAIVRCLVVLAVSCLTWVLFRVESVADAVSILERMVLWQHGASSLSASASSWDILTKAFPVFVFAEFFSRHEPHPLRLVARLPKPVRWLIYAAMIWGTLYYMPDETGEFVYFQF